jgi:hypothetical protein
VGPSDGTKLIDGDPLGAPEGALLELGLMLGLKLGSKLNVGEMRGPFCRLTISVGWRQFRLTHGDSNQGRLGRAATLTACICILLYHVC